MANGKDGMASGRRQFITPVIHIEAASTPLLEYIRQWLLKTQLLELMAPIEVQASPIR